MLIKLTEAELQAFLSGCGEYFAGRPTRINVDEARFRSAGYGPWLYYLSDENTKTHSPELAHDFFAASAAQMEQEAGLQSLYAKLAAAKIAFVPIKGADLAFHCYPEPALRAFSDWDIWVLPENIEKFCQLLADDGWSCPLDTQGEHHRGGRCKGKFCLEPHFSLPNFAGIAPEELWQYTEAVPGKLYERRLSGALNLIMLMAHGMCVHFQTINTVKFLLDMAVILHCAPMDWQQVDALCVRWKLAHPGLVLAAFPELFGNRYDCRHTFTAESVKALRELLLATEDLVPQLGNLEAAKGDWRKPGKIGRYLRHFSRNNLSRNYPEAQKSRWRYWQCVYRDFRCKVKMAVQGQSQCNSLLRKQLEMEALVEQSWRQVQAERK